MCLDLGKKERKEHYWLSRGAEIGGVVDEVNRQRKEGSVAN